MKIKWQEIFKVLSDWRYLIVLILLSLIPLFDLLHSGLPVTHDGQDHIARIANFYQSLSEGNIVPRWAEKLNWGYGHPILMFLYPLPSYLASFFHFLGFSLVDSVKLVFGITFIASGIAMFIWIKEFLGEHAGVVAGALYLFAPYRLVDLYVRGTIGEHMAFVFPPLICYFLLKLSKKFSLGFLLGASLSLAALILSHNAVTIMFFPFILFYCIYLFYSTGARKKFLMSAIVVCLLGIGLSAFFLFPAYLEGKYTLRDIVTKNEYSSRFVNPLDFIYSPWSYGGTHELSKQIGFIQLFSVISSPFVFYFLYKKKSKKNNILFLYVLSLSLFIITVFLMMQQSKFIWETVTTLQKFQFPWRFLHVSVFVTSILGGFLVSIVPISYKKNIMLITMISLFFLNKEYIKANGYLQKPESFYTNIYNGTTDTGESAPIWSVRFMEFRPKSNIEIIDGKAERQEIQRTSTKHIYITESNIQARIRENTVYFPGWNVYVNNNLVDVEFQDPANRGVITFYVPPGKHTIKILFEDTKVRRISNIVSLLSWGLFSILIIVLIFRKRGAIKL